jgi:UDP-N-acetylmuramate dehydrogenase
MKLQEIFGDRLKPNEPLGKHTTYRIGGPADFYLEVKTEDEVVSALAAAKEDNLPVFILGGGSNVLVSDEGVRGLTMVPALRKTEIGPGRVYAEAGALTTLFVRLVCEAGLAGMEGMSGIPGTVGGAVRGNAGAYGSNMGDVVSLVRAIDLRDGRLAEMPKERCAFEYRGSIFKKEPYFILGAGFSLRPGDKGLLVGKTNEIVATRNAKLPSGVFSAGSVFKNHAFDSPEELSERVRARLPAEYLAWKKIPAAWLIDLLDLKGKTIGKAMISERHANYFVNTGNATASEVMQLISYAKMKVRDELGIQLNEEIEYVGF